MSLNSLLGMGGGSSIYITVSPACGLELIELDKNGAIKSYAQTPLEYNEALREISDYNEFKESLENLFQMRNIDPSKAQVYLSVPTVWFGSKEGLPLLLDESAITNIVLGELEQTYIFKRKEPIPYWFDNLASQNSDSRSIFYSAVQREAVEQIRSILAGMGATLVSVNCSLFSILKGLKVTGIANEQMQDGTSWSLMLINNSGFQMLGMQGQKILEYYEEPLPLKSYEGEELYTAIENAAQITLMSTPSSSLIVISETDLVSAEILGTHLNFTGKTICVEENQYRREPLMDMSLNILADDQIKVSLHAIGAHAPAGFMPIDVNFIAEKGKNKVAVATITIGKMELTPAKATLITFLLLLATLIPIGLGFLISDKLMKNEQAKSTELDNKITALDAELKEFEKDKGETGFDPLVKIEQVLKDNRTKIMAYAAIGESIPRNLFLTYFMTADNGKINIKGCADSVEDVYVFFKNLKDSLLESDLRLSKLDLKAGSLDKVVNSTASTIDDAPYMFEITNMNENELKSFIATLTGGKVEKTETQEKNESTKSSSGNDQKDPSVAQ